MLVDAPHDRVVGSGIGQLGGTAAGTQGYQCHRQQRADHRHVRNRCEEHAWSPPGDDIAIGLAERADPDRDPLAHPAATGTANPVLPEIAVRCRPDPLARPEFGAARAVDDARIGPMPSGERPYRRGRESVGHEQHRPDQPDRQNSPGVHPPPR
ncbi:hypothetical protein Q3A91_04440 [Nocardia mangyaensis]|nr:hypothetical protein [Nocardia mangyaensis]